MMTREEIDRIVLDKIKELNEANDYTPKTLLLDDGENKYVITLYFDGYWKYNISIVSDEKYIGNLSNEKIVASLIELIGLKKEKNEFFTFWEAKEFIESRVGKVKDKTLSYLLNEFIKNGFVSEVAPLTYIPRGVKI